MIDKNEDKQHKALMAALEKMQAPLEVLALFKLAEEFYTKEERMKLYAEYKELLGADMAAYENLNKARTAQGNNLTWEQRVEKYGEEVATEQLAPHLAAMEARSVTSGAVMAFEKEHRIVLRLLDAKKSFSKGRYD